MNQINRLRPACTKMFANTNEETIELFLDELKNTNPSNLRLMEDYILFPLITKIDCNKLNTEIKFKLINTLIVFIEATAIRKLIPLKVIIVVMLKQVLDMELNSILAHLSEELMLAVVQCIDTVFRKSTTDVKSEFYTPKCRSIIGQIVFVCTQFIEKEIYKKLRISSVKCLLSTLYIDDDADFSDIVLRDQISNEVYIMTPKVLAVLKSIALGDEKLGHTMISMSVKAIGRFLCLIFEDYNRALPKPYLTIDDFKALINNSTLNECNKPDPNILKVETNLNSPRTDEWLHAAILKIKPTVDGMKVLIGSQNSKTRLELAELSICLLQKCLKFIRPCMNQFVEIILALSQDKDQSVSCVCETAIRTTMQELSFHEIVEQTFYTHIIQLPRIIAVGDEDEQMAAMLLLKGLLHTLCNGNLRIIFANKDTLERFTTMLLSAAELKRDMSLLLDEYSLRNVDENDGYTVVPTWKQFKNLINQAIVEHLQSICEIIGASNASDVVVGYLLELLPENLNNCNEVIVLLQMLLASNGHRTSICNCLEYFLLDHHWYLAIQANKSTKLEMAEFGDSQWYEDHTKGLYESAVSIRYTDVRWNGVDCLENNNEITISDAMFNVLHTCLILESVGRFACVLQKSFQPYMFRSLHKILEKSGSNNTAIHMAGLFALNQLKIGFGYDSISNMIHDNSDYITYYVNLSLKKVNESQSALDILSVVLKYSSLNSMPHLENIISTVLNESSKNEQNSNMGSFLKVFKMILLRIEEWNILAQPTDNTEIEPEDDEIEIRKNWLKLLDPIEDEFNDKNFDENFDEAKFLEEQKQKLDNENESNDDLDGKEVLPIYIDVTLQIMKRCIKYLSSKSQLDKCIVVESIICGLNILKSTEKQLLPVVHLVWKPFVERFKENDPIVLRRCFQLLMKLGDVSKDFIYQRTAKEVLPFVLSYLTSSGKNSINVKDVTYEHTQQFKLQMELIQSLPELLIAIEISEKDVNAVMDAMLVYCRDDQHKILQENVVKFILKFASYDCTAVYVKLLHYQNKKSHQSNINKILKNL